MANAKEALWETSSALSCDLFQVSTFSELMVKVDPLNLDLYDYNGFDADVLYNHLLEIAKKHSMTKVIFVNNVFQLVLIGLLRGNIRKDQTEKTVESGKAKLEELVKIWGIHQKKAKNDPTKLTKTTVTFSRIISLFPVVASQILFMGGDKFNAKLPNSNEIYKFKSHLLPNAMKHTGFASLIPKDEYPKMTELLTITHTAFMVEFGMMITNKKKADYDFKGAFTDQTTYREAAMNNNTPDYERLKFIWSFDIFTVDNFPRLIEVANSVMETLGKAKKFDIKEYRLSADGKYHRCGVKSVKKLSEDVAALLKTYKKHNSNSIPFADVEADESDEESND